MTTLDTIARPGETDDRAPESDKLFTTGELAARLRVDPQTVTGWVKAGLLPALHAGGDSARRYLYRRADVEATLGAPLPTRGEDVYMAAEVERLLAVGRTTVHRRVLRGELPHFRLPGGALRFRREDIAALARGES